MSAGITPDASDKQLSRALQDGDGEALAELIRRHHSALTGYLFQLAGGDSQLAEDLAQDTFMQVLRNIAQYDAVRPFKPWLYRIATNLARNHYNRADTRRTQSDDGALENLVSREITPEERVERREDAGQVAAVLQALPDHQREVIALRYFQELSLAEISETLDIPVGTVKSRLSLGLKQARSLLAEEAQS